MKWGIVKLSEIARHHGRLDPRYYLRQVEDAEEALAWSERAAAKALAVVKRRKKELAAARERQATICLVQKGYDNGSITPNEDPAPQKAGAGKEVR